MRKKYSDPLMFPAILLSGGIDAGASPNSGYGGDEEWGDDDGNNAGGNASSLMMNSRPALKVADPLTIDSNPVEESVTSAEAAAGDPAEAGSVAAPSLLEVEPVIDEIVPDAAAPSGAAE